jgi:cellulose biosynthesis protein BcsQ
MLATKGQRVLLADFDPQCNLTGMVMGFKGVDDLDGFYSSNPPNNVKDALAPAFESQPRQIVGADCEQVNGVENLFLLPGSIGLSEYETTLGIAQELSGALLPLRNLPGALRFMLEATAAKYDIDIILVDLSPSLGAINQNLLTTSDFFIVPLHPDYFSSMALTSLARALPRWQAWANTAYSLDVLQHADYPFPKPHATFAGAIIQKYRPRNGRASSAFQKWINQLNTGLEKTMVPALSKAGMINRENYVEKLGKNPWEPLMEVADFNSLIAFSQNHQVPVFALGQNHCDQKGAVWERTEQNIELFKTAFSECADRLLKLVVV